ncbi:nucleoredoxin-like protein 2 [Galendromus occidentalis]|uniref:Nucleoredoxin-like protein 2 n=1 Tax=Galendromus occidentalis TaxID=34638 RepID=A0AAJ6QS16_9ACAR|nr:nucleoredoxin-like protein 2 [Galendromus occidentalis]
MPGRLCACYKCIVSGRSWNLSVADFLTDRSLLAPDGEETEFEKLLQRSDTLVALLFSSSRSCICESFCEQLFKTQDSLLRTGHHLHVIYVSSDRSSREMLQFIRKYPNWFSLRFSDQAIRELQSFLEVHTVPSLVILSSTGIVSRTGTKDISRLGTRAWDKWVSRS